MYLHRSHARHIFIAVCVTVVILSGLSAVAIARDKPAPVVEGSAYIPPAKGASKPVGTFEQRLSQLERRLKNQSMMEVLTRLDRLQQEIQKVVGELEVQTHEIENIKKRQRSLYLDIDRRISQAEKAMKERTATAASPTPATTAFRPTPGFSSSRPSATQNRANSGKLPSISDTGSTSRLDREAYDSAFNLLKNGRYDLAIAAFKAFLETYPNARYADNAQYWLGEANYVQKRYKPALEEFNRVVKNYPNSPKKADALLKIGYTQGELGAKKAAIKTLNKIIKQHPDTTAARLAKQRVLDLKRKR